MKVRISLVAAIFAVSAGCYASSEYLDIFLTHYKLSDSSKLAEKSCGICHVSDSDFGFNSYGRDMVKTMTDKGAQVADAAVLTALEELDSDGDGTPNGAEITGGTDPATSEAAPTTEAAVTPEKPKAFPPKNAYHPAVVHFPIALFIAGILFDFLGLIRKNKNLLWAGWCNMLLAAVTALGAVITGFAAMALLKLPFRGLIFDHMLYALGASFLMWIMVSLRIHRHEQMNMMMRGVYYVLALGCLFAISWAGHLGGVFVYGE